MVPHPSWLTSGDGGLDSKPHFLYVMKSGVSGKSTHCKFAIDFLLGFHTWSLNDFYSALQQYRRIFNPSATSSLCICQSNLILTVLAPKYRWVCARKTSFQCVSTGVMSFLHQPINIMMSCIRNIFLDYWFLCREVTGGFSSQGASDAEFWYFLCCYKSDEKTV